MPQALPIIGNIALNLAIGVGASLIAGILSPKQSLSSASSLSNGTSFDLSVGEAVPLSTLFGRARTAGHLLFAQSYGDNNNYLKVVISCGRGNFDALEEFIADEVVATLSGSNADVDGQAVGGKWTVDGTPYMWVKTYAGAPGQTADPGLIAAANPTDRWTAAHTLTGASYAIVTMRWNSDLYGGALPTFGFVWRGLKLYDWREDSTAPGGSGTQRFADPSTWVWTENPAVIAYNWRRGININGVRVLGFGFPATANDLSYFTATANVADETVLYPESGASLVRYAYGKEVTDADDRLDVLRGLEAAWCGASFSRGGAYAPVPAATQASQLTLKDSHRLVGYPVKTNRWGPVSGKKTAWAGQFISQADGWQSTPYGTRVDTALESLLGGRKTFPFDQPFEYKTERAQMRAEIALRRQAYSGTRTETFGPRALVLEAGDCISRESADWGTLLMIVDSVERLPDRTGATLSLSEWNNAIVPASNQPFVDLPASVGTSAAAADRTLTIPSPFTVLPYSIVGSGATLPGARATWPQITDPNVTEVLVRVWPTAGSEANDAVDVTASAKLQTAKIFGPLQDNTQFTYKGTVIRSDGRTTVFTSTGTFTTGATVVPAEVADGSVTIEKLGEDLQNQSGIITDFFPGSIPDQLAQILALIEQLGNDVVTGDDTNKKKTSALVARMGASTAAIIRNETAIATETAARATAIEEVIAQVGDVIADGYLKFDSLVDTDTATATITAKVKAVNGTHLSQAAWILKASVEGEGDVAYFGVLGTFYVFDTVDGEPIPALAAGNGVVKFHRLESFAQNDDGTPVVILDGDSGAFSITVT